MTIGQQEFGRPGLPDLSSMTEEEQIAYAMQMSLQGAGAAGRPGALRPGALRRAAAGLGAGLSTLASFPQSLPKQKPLTLKPVQPWTRQSPPR